LRNSIQPVQTFCISEEPNETDIGDVVVDLHTVLHTVDPIIGSNDINMFFGAYRDEAGGGEEADVDETYEKLVISLRASGNPSGNMSGNSTKACSKQTSIAGLNFSQNL
jgi:hypothetical protein